MNYCTGNCRQGRDCPARQACRLPEPDDECEPLTGAEAVRFWLTIVAAGLIFGALWAYFR